jgi:hypothetical protein
MKPKKEEKKKPELDTKRRSDLTSTTTKAKTKKITEKKQGPTRCELFFNDEKKRPYSFVLINDDDEIVFFSTEHFKTKEEAKKVAKELLKKNENPLPETCEFCGLEYDDFKTGLTFADVRRDMWRAEEDPSQWKYKRRRGVLGAWRGAKQMMWREHLDACEGAAADKKKKSKKPTKKEVEKLKKGLEKEFKKKKEDDEVPF